MRWIATMVLVTACATPPEGPAVVVSTPAAPTAPDVEGARLTADRCDVQGCWPATAGPVPDGASTLRVRWRLPDGAPVDGWRLEATETCRGAKGEARRVEPVTPTSPEGEARVLARTSPSPDGPLACRWRVTLAGPGGAGAVLEDAHDVPGVSGSAAPR